MFIRSSVRHPSRTSVGVATLVIALFPLVVHALPGDDGQPAIISGIGHVVDGDTLDVGATRIRLEGIDAPEIAQTCQTAWGETWNCGVAAATMLRKLAEHRELMCERKGNDRYRRVLATCFADGVDIDEAMVRVGLAWAFVRYSKRYVAVETQARSARVGVWQGAAEAPWDFRHNEWKVAETSAPKGCAIKGNVSSRGRIFHMPWDPWYDRVKMNPGKGKRWFCSEQEAIEAGWRPASAN